MSRSCKIDSVAEPLCTPAKTPWTAERLLELKAVLEHGDSRRLSSALRALQRGAAMSLELLRQTGIGKSVGKLRNHVDASIAFSARAIVADWKACPGVAAVVAARAASRQPRAAPKRYRMSMKGRAPQGPRGKQALPSVFSKVPSSGSRLVVRESQKRSVRRSGDGTARVGRQTHVKRQQILKAGCQVETNTLRRDKQLHKTKNGRTVVVETLTVQRRRFL